ncbi:MAG TPA: PQQ-dependent sugar dehydrogenase [Methanocella sp.]
MARSSEMKFLIVAIPLLLLAIMVLLAQPLFTPGTSSGASNATLPLELIKLPPGFTIDIYASNVPGARQMALSPNGTLFVGTRSPGKVYAIPAASLDGRVDRAITLVSGLNQPAGVEFRNGSLYVSACEGVLRYDDIDSRLNDVPAPVTIIWNFTVTSEHAWKHIRFGPDGLLYIPIGAPEDNVEESDPLYASILRLSPNGSGLEVYARGIRNTLGMDWDPLTGELWFTENGQNSVNDSVPTDEINRAPQAGLHFGYPYVHGKNYRDPVYGTGRNISDYTTPELELEPHVAPLGLRFYTGDMFPGEYRNQLFVSEHGSMPEFTPTGYRIELVTLNASRQATGHRVFAEGWLQDNQAWGRPVDLLVMPDGSLLVSDDNAGVIYRITYSPPDVGR